VAARGEVLVRSARQVPKYLEPLSRVQGNGGSVFPETAPGNEPYRKKGDWIGKEKRGDRCGGSYRDHVWQRDDVIVQYTRFKSLPLTRSSHEHQKSIRTKE